MNAVYSIVQAFRIREVAMCIIGRLSNLNPAFVMPSLRKSLIQVSNIWVQMSDACVE